MENKKNYLILPIDLDEYKEITYEQKEIIFDFAKYILQDNRRIKKFKEEQLWH